MSPGSVRSTCAYAVARSSSVRRGQLVASTEVARGAAPPERFPVTSWPRRRSGRPGTSSDLPLAHRPLERRPRQDGGARGGLERDGCDAGNGGRRATEHVLQRLQDRRRAEAHLADDRRDEVLGADAQGRRRPEASGAQLPGHLAPRPLHRRRQVGEQVVVAPAGEGLGCRRRGCSLAWTCSGPGTTGPRASGSARGTAPAGGGRSPGPCPSAARRGGSRRRGRAEAPSSDGRPGPRRATRASVRLAAGPDHHGPVLRGQVEAEVADLVELGRPVGPGGRQPEDEHGLVRKDVRAVRVGLHRGLRDAVDVQPAAARAALRPTRRPRR